MYAYVLSINLHLHKKFLKDTKKIFLVKIDKFCRHFKMCSQISSENFIGCGLVADTCMASFIIRQQVYN
jgi:hypothetical protein